MAEDCPQALQEAGLSCERADEGKRLVIRDVNGSGCAIRSRGGEALAAMLARDRTVCSLDLREANLTDNGVGQLCLRLRRTDQLEELSLGEVGHAGLSFLSGAVNCCNRLQKLSFQLRDAPTLHAGRQNQSPNDHDTASYKKPEKKEGEEESEGEGDEAAEEAGDDDEEPEERERKKAEKLKKLFRENDYNSEDEGEDGSPPRRPKVQETEGSGNTSAPFRELLQEFVNAVDKKQNLLQVVCDGVAVPADLQLDLQRAVTRHQEARDKKLRAKEERGARTAHDTLKDQMEELRSGLEQLDEANKPHSSVGAILGESDDQGGALTRLGVRSFVSRRLFAALGEALFECQRFKSKENEAVSTAEGEMAFVAMYLRQHAGK